MVYKPYNLGIFLLITSCASRHCHFQWILKRLKKAFICLFNVEIHTLYVLGYAKKQERRIDLLVDSDLTGSAVFLRKVDLRLCPVSGLTVSCQPFSFPMETFSSTVMCCRPTPGPLLKSQSPELSQDGRRYTISQDGLGLGGPFDKAPSLEFSFSPPSFSNLPAEWWIMPGA